MNEPLPTDDREQRLERIVAYLDGELSPQESAEVELQLAADEEFRRDLQRMERTWLALDELPHTPVDDNFSRTTMEMVVRAAKDEVNHMTAALPVQKRKRQISGSLLTLGAILMGVLVGKLLWVDPNQELVDDLPIIQYADSYFQIPSVDFLRELDGVLNAEAVESSASKTDEQVAQFQLVNNQSNRQEWLESLPDEQRLTLRAKLNRYRAMSPQQQQRIRTLHEEIVDATDSDRLQRVLVLYQQWLQGLSSSEQYELREMATDERAERVTKMIEDETANRALELSPEELQALYDAVMERREAIMENAAGRMSPRERREFEKLKRGDQFFFLFRQHSTDRFADIYKVALYTAIIQALPPEKREVFQQLPRPAQLRQVGAWMMQAESLRRQSGKRKRRGNPTEQELEAFFVESVDPKMYEKLLAMPSDQMQRVLTALYKGNVSTRDWSMLEDMQPREAAPFGPPWMEDSRPGRPRGPNGPGGGRFRPGQDAQRPGPGRSPGPGRRDGPPGGEAPFGGPRRFEDQRGFAPGTPPRDPPAESQE